MLWPFKKMSMMELENIAVKRAMARVIDERTYYGFSGHPRVKEFEGKLSRLLDGAPVLGINSGTDSLILALKLFGIGRGDEVIVPAFSFISTASSVGWTEATPVFVDIRTEDYALDPARLEEKITSRTKAIIIAHLFGQPALGTSEILTLAKKRSIPIIEDAAQSFGSNIKINGAFVPVGTIGNIGCLSFSSTKPFAAPGNGGAIILHDKNLYDKANKMRFYGAERPYFEYPVIGVNIKLHEVQAAALLAKLNFFDHWLSHRRKLSEIYREHLTGIGDLALPQEQEGTKRIWYRYVMRTKRRDELFAYLKNEFSAHRHLQPTLNYPVPLPYFSAFATSGHKSGDFPTSDLLAREVISLPINNYVIKENVLRVAESVQKFFEK